MQLGDALVGISGGLSVALAFVLLLRAPSSRATRVFAYWLILGGLATLAWWLPKSFEPFLWYAGSATSNYFILPSPFLLAVFALWYPRPRGRLGSSPWLLPVALGLGVALVALYAADVAWAGAGRWPLTVVRLLNPLFTAGVALLFVRDALRGVAAAHETSLLLLAAALAIHPAYVAARSLVYAATGLTAGLGTQGTFWALALLPALAATVLLARRATSSAGALRRRWWNAAALFAAGPLIGVGVGLLVAGALWIEPLIRQVPSGLVATGSVALMTYALLRHRLFDLDLVVKRTIRESTVVTAFIAVLLLTREGAGAVLAPGAADALGLAATGGMALGLTRLRHAGARVADRALPTVAEGDAAYLNQRKLEVYRAALEESMTWGAPAARDAGRLAALRQELGLTDRDHALLAFAVGAPAGASSPQAPLREGALVLGRYRVERRLGEGSHGTTYAARDEAGSGAHVALKALRPGEGSEAGILREARALQAVRHPRVVALRETGTHGRQGVLVMEYVAGGSLAAALAAGPFPRDRFPTLARDLLEGLGAVHAAGLVHRDVKPSNVLLDAGGRAKLADFGVAHMPGFETTAGSRGDLAHAIGTVRFMSPEQARGRRVTERSDLFSAAATLYEAWTGTPYLAPRPGESAMELQMRAAAGLRFPGMAGPRPLAAWFARALDPRPERRFPSDLDMGSAFEDALRPAGAQPDP